MEKNTIPSDIPIQPQQRYQRQGWKNWKDFLVGANNIYKSFEEARDFVVSLGLKSKEDWNEYTAGRLKDELGEAPKDIPKNPNFRYKKDLKPWNWDYWLGISENKEKWLDHDTALKLVQAKMNELNLSGQKDWNNFRSSKDFPKGVPTDPKNVYGKQYNMQDWYNTNRTRRVSKKPIRTTLSFEEARNFVRNLEVKPFPSQPDWLKYHEDNYDFMSKNEIVKSPHATYRDRGFTTYADWLGLKKAKNILSFEDAKQIVQPLNLQSEREYKEWRDKTQRYDLPSNLTQQYKKHPDWKGIPEFLGKL